MEIVKWQKPVTPPDVDAFMLAMWLMYCRAPRNPEPDETGAYSLGDIVADAEKTWERWCPYTIARKP